MRTLSWINVVLGVWLIVAAMTLSTSSETVRTEESVAGVLIAVLAYASAVTPPKAAVSWAVAMAGVWTVLVNSGPFTVPKLNAMIVGVIVLVLGVANGIYRQHHTTHHA
jgi:hypothetical protein